MKRKVESTDSAVSPVVGVMLMLVVTIIIAAVVSNLAGGMFSEQEPAPIASIDVTIKSLDSTDYSPKYPAYGSFQLEVLSISRPISTKDVKLITSYTTTNRSNGEMVSNITTLVASKINNTNYSYSTYHYEYNSPLGFGPGVSGTAKTSGNYTLPQNFGNYTLTAGTYMSNSGVSYDAANATDHYPHTLAYALENIVSVNPLDAILGTNWVHLKPGDTVRVTLTDLTTNGVICDKKVIVS